MRASLAAIVIFLGGISLAQVEPGSADAPVPSSIRGSKERYDDALKQAEAAYRKAKLAATNAYLRDVKGAVAEATKVGNLDQATVLNGIKKQLEAEVKNISAGVVRVESKIVAGKRWQSVMPVHTGETLKITAVGTWCAATLSRDEWTSDADGNHRDHLGGAETPLPGVPYNALVGRIGDKVFLVGRHAEIVASQDGVLDLRMNVGDNDPHTQEGQLTVTILSN
jgi:hypothetical protein